MSNEAQVSIRGIPDIPSITEVNVRAGAGTNHDIVFKIPVGSSGLSILEVQPDNEQRHLNGKVYQWFKLRFHGGADGWVRDDLLDCEGDLTQWGYGVLNERTFVHALVRTGFESVPSGDDRETTFTPVGVRDDGGNLAPPDEVTAGEFKDAPDDLDRVRKAAFLITAAFEGRGYSAYQNYDHGIVSYGIIQFTLAAGSLARVIQIYLNRSSSDVADKLQAYLPRVQSRDVNLRHDTDFRDLLIQAADEPAMQEAQDLVATQGFWKAVVDGYITHRNIRLPLSWALLFDMGVNFGVNHGFVRLAEQQLGIPPRSTVGTNGVSEQQLIRRVAELRKVSHDRQAERDNLPGLRRRGDFWMALVNRNDWYLRGRDGMVDVNGLMINITNFQ